MTSFHPFRLDTVNQCLWRKSDAGGDERILLPPKAYGVLRYLVERGGSLVTQDELLDAVWPDTHIQPEGLKSQILHLRRVLGDHPKCPRFIETLPRRGYRFIGSSREEAVPDAVSLGGPGPTRLVGREGALAELGDGLRRALQRKRQIVFVTGESGIGKTSLIDAFQLHTDAAIPGLRIARGQCVEGYGGKEPYYPMLEALGQLCRGPGCESIVATLAAQAPTWLAQFPALLKREHRETLQREILGATRERMLREICEAVETITTDSALLLVFEDLQWVDQATVDLIGALARRRGPAKLMLVGTYRPVDLTLSDHPLKALKQELLLHQLCREIALEPLSEAQITEFLAAPAPGASQSAGLVELIHRHSGGNPLFMVAALEHLTQRGLISREGGGWQLRLPLEQIVLGVPEGLRQMIEAQIDRLSVEERQALEAASVVGAAFAVDVGAAAAGLEPDGFEDLCERLSRRHRIVRAAAAAALANSDSGQRYEFVHALYREVFYQRQAPGRRAKLHRRVGERLETLFAQRLSEVALELADHFEKSSDWPRAIKYLRLAADRAGGRYAYREATGLLQQALGLARQLPDASRAASETELLEKLATIYVASFDMRAIETYEALRVRAVHHGLIEVHVRALVKMAFFLSWISSPRCLEVVERAFKLSSGLADPLLRARTRMQCFFWREMAGGWNAEDAEGCRIELDEIRRADDRLALASHLIDYSYIQWGSSEYREAHESAIKSRSILFEGHEENPYLSRQYWASQVASSWSLMFLGEWGEALQESKAAIAKLAKNGDDQRAQNSQLYRAWLYLHAMDFASALAICDSVLPLVRDPSRIYPLRVGLILAGAAEAGLGNHNRALGRLLAARNEMGRQTVMLDWYWRMQLESALTEVWLGKHDLGNARWQATQFFEATQATAERTWQALAWEANARVAMAGEDVVRAQECIDHALSTINGGEFPLAAWRVSATAAELFDRTGDQGSAEHHRELSRAIIFRLAHSLPAAEPLRGTFLSAPTVRSVYAGTTGGQALKVA
jgi:DNA-binding winged helix-turn-helix (wHTH) protein/tetratricopeptide (TPR) repeat protein